MLQVCAHLRFHPYRYHGGDSGTTRKPPARRSPAAPPRPGNRAVASATRRGGGPWRRAGPAAARRARGRARPAPSRATPPRRRAVAAAVTCSSMLTAPSPRRHRGEHGPCAPGAAPSPRHRRSPRLLLLSSSRGRQPPVSCPDRTRKGGDAQRVSSVLPVAGENKASLPSLAYLSIGDVNRERGAGYVDLA